MSSVPPVTMASALPDSTSLPPGAMIRYSAAAIRSAGRRAALAAELRPAERGPAVSAEFLRGLGRREGVSAGLAEFPAAGPGVTVRAGRGGLVAVVDVLGPVDFLDLVVQLLDLSLGLQPGDLLVQPGRAGNAQATLGIPADALANPLAVTLALLEVWLHLL